MLELHTRYPVRRVRAGGFLRFLNVRSRECRVGHAHQRRPCHQLSNRVENVANKTGEDQPAAGFAPKEDRVVRVRAERSASFAE